MLPIPARSAVLGFAGGAAILLLGVLASSPTTASLGGGALLALATAFAFTIPIGARLRSQRIELAWWVGHGEGSQGSTGVVAGVPFELRCFVRNGSRHGLRFTELLPVVPDGVRVLEGLGAELWLPPRTRTELCFRLNAIAAGRVVVQGLGVAVPGPLGLFSAPLYFPSPLTVKVLPRAASRGGRSTRLGSGEAVERAGLTPLRRRGAGTELHEIREHRPGDAFKSIAWKASARAGKLLVREVEREVQDTLELVLDVSGSMRGGAPGERKLDHCIEVAALLARDALERGDRVGLVTVDGRVVSQVADAEGVRHMLRIYDTLLHATEVVDADLTHADDAAVTAIVGLYLRQQEGVELFANGAWDLPALARHAARALQTELDQPQVVASSPEHALLRRFCRMRGLALPYRAETRGLAKASGLAQALRKAAGAGRSPRTLLLLTDLDGISELEPLLQTLRLLSLRKHRIALVVPDAATLMPPAQSDLETELRRVYAMQEARRLGEARKLLGALGIPVLTYDARLGEGGLLRSAASLRRVA